MKDIEQKFRENKVKALSNLNEIKAKIERVERDFNNNKTNWGYVGDMYHIADQLNQMLE